MPSSHHHRSFYTDAETDTVDDADTSASTDTDASIVSSTGTSACTSAGTGTGTGTGAGNDLKEKFFLPTASDLRVCSPNYFQINAGVGKQNSGDCLEGGLKLMIPPQSRLPATNMEKILQYDFSQMRWHTAKIKDTLKYLFLYFFALYIYIMPVCGKIVLAIRQLTWQSDS